MTKLQKRQRSFLDRVHRDQVSHEEFLEFCADPRNDVQSWASFYADPEAYASYVGAQVAQIEQAAAAKRRDRQRRLEDAGVLPKDLGLILAGKLQPTKALATVRESIARSEWLLVVSGPVGIGKSVAAGVWIDELDRDGRFITAGDLQAVGLFDAAARRALEQVGALVIDDLGSEFFDVGGAFGSSLDQLVDKRYSHLRPTLITSNMPGGREFLQRYGERLVDRVREAGRFVTLSGKSLRGARR